MHVLKKYLNVIVALNYGVFESVKVSDFQIQKYRSIPTLIDVGDLLNN